jgi:ketosteroid isomerase-like protein
MSQENLAVVQAAFAAYLRDDEATGRELIEPDVRISTRPDQPDARELHGLAGLRQASSEWTDAWAEHTIEAVEFLDAGDSVLVRTREEGRGRTSGIPMHTGSTFVFTLSNGKVARIQIFGSHAEAIKAVGLEE